jgi:hypothetical protein
MSIGDASEYRRAEWSFQIAKALCAVAASRVVRVESSRDGNGCLSQSLLRQILNNSALHSAPFSYSQLSSENSHSITATSRESAGGGAT